MGCEIRNAEILRTDSMSTNQTFQRTDSMSTNQYQRADSYSTNLGQKLGKYIIGVLEEFKTRFLDLYHKQDIKTLDIIIKQ